MSFFFFFNSFSSLNISTSILSPSLFRLFLHVDRSIRRSALVSPLLDTIPFDSDDTLA
jgi:hypothetical protein